MSFGMLRTSTSFCAATLQTLLQSILPLSTVWVSGCNFYKYYIFCNKCDNFVEGFNRRPDHNNKAKCKTCASTGTLQFIVLTWLLMKRNEPDTCCRIGLSTMVTRIERFKNASIHKIFETATESENDMKAEKINDGRRYSTKLTQ